MVSSNEFSSISTGKTIKNQYEYKKIFRSRTVRKLAAIQFINGLFLIALHMLNHPFYGKDDVRIFTGGFISGKKVVIVLMVFFYWVTGITGVVYVLDLSNQDVPSATL